MTDSFVHGRKGRAAALFLTLVGSLAGISCILWCYVRFFQPGEGGVKYTICPSSFMKHKIVFFLPKTFPPSK